MSKRIGPGPGAYPLSPLTGFKEHDITKERKPMYSFGNRPVTKYATIGPGPSGTLQDNHVFKCCEKVYTRYGETTKIAYSLGQRLLPLKKDKMPGPCDHDLYCDKKPCKNQLFYKGPNPPCYSFAYRTEIRDKDKKPSPNDYVFHTKLTKPMVPCYSLGLRTGLKPLIRSPGPAAYTFQNSTKKMVFHTPPSFSLGARINPLKNCTTTPAPSKYNPNEKTDTKVDGYSFGIRHNEYAPPMIVCGDN